MIEFLAFAVVAVALAAPGVIKLIWEMPDGDLASQARSASPRSDPAPSS